MTRIIFVACGVAALLGTPLMARAETLNLTITADNAFSIYLSTDDTVKGDFIGTNVGGPAGQWSTSVTFNPALLGSTYYLHVIGTNYTAENGYYPPSSGTPGTLPNPDAFLGQFSITGGSQYSFANGTTSFLTNSTAGQWRGVDVLNNTSWTQPTANVQSYGVNNSNPIWGTVSGISTSAEWIWSSPDNGQYADLSTTINFRQNANLPAVPLPGALPLFVSGLGALSFFSWRRSRKSATVAAA